jgi:glycosyltransferase involved in cell wall biosynthesis
MKNALIFYHNFEGHRQVYSQFLSQVLLSMDYKVFIAGPFYSITDKCDYPYIEILENNANVEFIDTKYLNKSELLISNEEFIDLQSKVKADLTIIAEADNYLQLINSQILLKNKRFSGKVIGIFIRSIAYFYEKPSFINRIRRIKNLPNLWQKDRKLFHEKLFPFFKLLDAALTIDENYVNKFPKNYRWLPDIYKPLLESKFIDEEEYKYWEKKIVDFKKDNKGKFFLLYFGTAQSRRGYDTLLKLAADEKCCFIHCGKRNDADKYDLDINYYRDLLYSDNAILETNKYIKNEKLIELFFLTCEKIILPYKTYLRSSGVMLQALDYGLPVLVSDVGPVAIRVKNGGLGWTYKDGDYEDFKKQFTVFRKMPITSFTNSINLFLKDYSSENQTNTLKSIIVEIEKDN